MLKRIIATSLVLVLLFSMIACQGTYHYPVGTTPGTDDDDGGYVPPQNIRTEKGGLYIKRDGTKIYVAKKV